MTAPANPVTPPTDPAAPSVTPQGDPATPPPTPADMPAAKPADPATPPAGKESDDGKTELEKVRREAANYRTKLREREAADAASKTVAEQQAAEMQALKDQFAAIGAIFNPDANQPPDPAKLVEQIAAKDQLLAQKDADYQQKIRDLSIQAALPGALAKAQAKPLTAKILKADGALAKLDPTADTFAADLESIVAAALEQDPDLKVAQVAPKPQRSGAEIPGRSGGSDQLTHEQIKGMSPEQIDEARVAGRLRTLLGG